MINWFYKNKSSRIFKLSICCILNSCSCPILYDRAEGSFSWNRAIWLKIKIFFFYAFIERLRIDFPSEILIFNHYKFYSYLIDPYKNYHTKSSWPLSNLDIGESEEEDKSLDSFSHTLESNGKMLPTLTPLNGSAMISSTLASISLTSHTSSTEIWKFPNLMPSTDTSSRNPVTNNFSEKILKMLPKSAKSLESSEMSGCTSESSSLIHNTNPRSRKHLKSLSQSLTLSKNSLEKKNGPSDT